MIFEKLKFSGLILVKQNKMNDIRGSFSETYKRTAFKKIGIKDSFVQENYSLSKINVLRGLHYQRAPFAQAKLVRCVKGRILDVVVDLRPKSSTFGKWLSVELSALNSFQLYVPIGFAHGFLTLEDNSEVIYKCSEEYALEFEAGIRWNDGTIGINWPCIRPTISDKDKLLPLFKDVCF